MTNKLIVCDTAATREAITKLLYAHGHTVFYVSPEFYGLQITSIFDNDALSNQVHNLINAKFSGRVSIVPEIGF